MGLLGLLMPVTQAAALLTLPSLVTNVWQAWAGSLFKVLWRRLWRMQLGIVVGVALAPVLFPSPPEALGRRLLGICLVTYGVIALLCRRPGEVPDRFERWLGPIAGLATGVITGLTGVFVLPAVPYLQALGLGKDGLSQALGVCFTTSTVALMAVLAAQGHLDSQASGLSAILVFPALAGLYLGQLIRGAMGETLFRRCFFAGLLLLGGWLTLR
jgi:uncharacterized membrane protein YfcA